MSPRPQFRFSLSALLLVVTAICVALGTFSLFEVIGVSLALAFIGAVMYQSGIKHNSKLISVVGFFLLMITSLLTIAWLFNWLILGEGPIYWQRNWPPELREMAKAFGAPHRIIARRYSHFGDQKEEYRWRIPLSRTQHATLKNDRCWETRPIHEMPVDFWERFPALWRPRRHAANVYHRTGSRNSWGFYSPDRYCAMYDPEWQLLYVHYRSVPP